MKAKLRMLKNKNFYILALSVIFAYSAYEPTIFAAEEQFVRVPTIIQISSKISDGRYKLSEIVEIAKDCGFKTIIFTERDIMHWEYGIFPLRNLIKKTIENNSLFTYGIKRYLEEVETLQKLNPKMVLIAGIETAPFYYWSGSIFKRDLKMHNEHKHLLVLGLETIKDLKTIPVIGNRVGLLLPFRIKDAYRLWPILALLFGVFLLRKNNKTGIFFIIFGLIFLLNNFPFRRSLFDQYHKDQGILPYQNLIDYVRQRGGLIFWAHPESEYYLKTSNTEVITKEHTQDFLTARGYTGFGIFYEGYKIIGKPGGLWDEVLMQYLEGKREKPVWAIGSLGFDYYGDLKTSCADLRNILLAKTLEKKDILDALRSGRVYVIRGNDSSDFILDKFVISNSSNSDNKQMGETLWLDKDKPIIKIGGYSKSAKEKEIKIKLIKNAEVVKTFDQISPFNIQYRDVDFIKGSKAYYRLEIVGLGLHLVTNPIFVETRIDTNYIQINTNNTHTNYIKHELAQIKEAN